MHTRLQRGVPAGAVSFTPIDSQCFLQLRFDTHMKRCLFTRDKIPRETVICKLTGTVVSSSTPRKEGDYFIYHSQSLLIHLDEGSREYPGAFANTAPKGKKNNSSFAVPTGRKLEIGEKVVIALRSTLSIPKGKQIFASYGLQMARQAHSIPISPPILDPYSNKRSIDVVKVCEVCHRTLRKFEVRKHGCANIAKKLRTE